MTNKIEDFGKRYNFCRFKQLNLENKKNFKYLLNKVAESLDDLGVNLKNLS